MAAMGGLESAFWRQAVMHILTGRAVTGIAGMA
jgi:hypothetical protein